ncbi:non-ribosomal peptide synthetase [Nonomuraea sp. B1E8]|uniref:non-ribosomal peptide synthetase n=1 Tax=unclassified Nonomuraea TaxID=2593643 RepID=UPI00325CC4FE
MHLAEADPDRPALFSADQCLSYGELLESGRRVATALTEQGLAPGSRVAIVARRNPRLVIQLLGVLLAGCQFAILDRTYPRARMRAMEDACRPHAVLDDDRLDKRDPVTPAAGAVSQDDAGPDTARAGQPAYLAFTSGTTGTPRCVQGGHAAVVHYLTWSPEEFDLHAGDRFGMLSGLSHDPLIRDVFTPLSLGAQLFIPDLRTWARPEALATWMREHRLTVTHLTPTMARRIFIPGQVSLHDLRRVLLGGEVVRFGDLHSFAQVAPEARFTVVYGCTETPQVAMHFTAADDELAGDAAAVVPLGEPAPAAEVEIISATGLAVPTGERGELVVRTPHLALGYLRQEGAALRLEPFGSQYATGDLAYRDTDGRLLFAGRSDRQVKIRGARVELDEIEHHFRSFPGVVLAAATVAQTHDGPSLQATVVVRPGSGVTEQELRKHIVALLPAPAVPSAITVLDTIPMTPNGKSTLSSDQTFQSADAVARRVSEILGAVLGRAPLAPDEDFFEQGGDSLAAIEAAATIESEFGYELSIEDIFMQSGAAELSKLVWNGLRPGSGPSSDAV